MYYFSLALLDSLNPASISLLIVLLPLVKKTSHVFFYIGGAFLTYLLIGLVFFHGVDRYLEKLIVELIEKYSVISTILGITAGITLIIIGALLTIRIIRSFKNEVELYKTTKKTFIKSVHPSMLLGLSVTSTLSDAPTSIPYIFFISKLAQINDPFIVMLIHIVIYCIIYILPMLILYAAYGMIKEKFSSIETWTRNVMSLLNKYGLPAVAYALGIWLIFISL